MTNYNERLDEILDRIRPTISPTSRPEAKQAITSLIKELVAEAKPLNYASPDKSEYQDGFNTCIRLYEQNLLKALEEV